MVALVASLEQYFYQCPSLIVTAADRTVSPYYGAIKQDCYFDYVSVDLLEVLNLFLCPESIQIFGAQKRIEEQFWQKNAIKRHSILKN